MQLEYHGELTGLWNPGSMYVVFLGINYLNLISVFEGQIGKIVDGEP